MRRLMASPTPLPSVAGVRTRVNGIASHELTVEAADATVPALYGWAGRAGVPASRTLVQSDNLAAN